MIDPASLPSGSSDDRHSRRQPSSRVVVEAVDNDCDGTADEDVCITVAVVVESPAVVSTATTCGVGRVLRQLRRLHLCDPWLAG